MNSLLRPRIVANLCVKEKTDMRNDYVLENLSGKLGVVNNRKRTTEAKSL